MKCYNPDMKELRNTGIKFPTNPLLKPGVKDN